MASELHSFVIEEVGNNCTGVMQCTKQSEPLISKLVHLFFVHWTTLQKRVNLNNHIMSKNLLKAAALLLLITACKGKEENQSNPIADFKTYSIEEFYESYDVGGGVYNSSGTKMLFSSKETGIMNVMEYDIETGKTRAITNSTKESCYAIDYVPNSTSILYSADKGGNELSHIYLLDAEGNVTDLTPGEQEKASMIKWSADKKSLYYISNARDPKFFDLMKMDIGEWKPILVFKNEDGYQIDRLSYNENLLGLSVSVTTNENESYIYDLRSGEIKKIHDAKGIFNGQGFSRDEATYYYVSNAHSDFMKLYSYDIANGEREVIYETNWDVLFSFLSKEENYQVIVVNNDGRNELKIIDQKTGKELELPDLDGEVLNASFSEDESRLKLIVGSSKSPRNIFDYQIADKTLKQVTNTLNPEINENHLVAAEVVRFKSFDGLEIPAIYYKPHTASTQNPAPSIVFVHGGPGGQSRQSYFALYQYLVNHGYAILLVNNRGSSGYGKAFKKMDDLNHGEADLQDCIYGKKWLAQQDYIDGDNIGIVGGSYGGYMTMRAMTHTPEEFKVGVNIFGVTNWIRTLKSIPPYWESFRQALYAELGDPFSGDSVRLREISPLFHADKIKHPVMVLQGANDPRVLQIESDEMVEAIKANNIPVEYVIFDDEGHGFVKKENEIEGYKKIRLFLDKYMKKESK